MRSAFFLAVILAGCGLTSMPDLSGGAPDGSSSSTDAGTRASGDGSPTSPGDASHGSDGSSSDASVASEGSAGPDGSSGSDGAGKSEAGPPPASGSARVVAYVNCLCGFGASTNAAECLASPDPTVNQVKAWEDAGTSPITHYVLSFLSFNGSDIQSDPGEIWADGGGKAGDFTLQAGLAAAMQSARARGKKVMLSIGGQAGSSGFLTWWSGLGATSPDRVAAMQARLAAVAQTFQTQNGVAVDGFDVDIELGGAYAYGSDDYDATRDLIDAIPDTFLAAFVPQIGNGLCAAPVVGDPLTPPTVLGGQCSQPVNGDDTPWVLARLDTECLRADGSPKLTYWGIQYYNAGTAECCGGGADEPSMITSAVQSYKNLANGWPASGDVTQASNPWNQWEYYPGPWAAFAGFGADRLVLGKPGCQGCAGSDYLDLPGMQQLLQGLDGKLAKPMGGLLFWDLCRLFGNTGPQCVSSACQPSWGGTDVQQNLAQLQAQMAALTTM